MGPRSHQIAKYHDLARTPLNSNELESFGRTLEKDVERTCENLLYFAEGEGRPAIQRILLVYARSRPNTSYVQGRMGSA